MGKFAEPEFAKTFARIENHYFMNGGFLGGSGEGNRGQNYILENVARIKDIPVHIVHGRYDLVCPMFQAEELVRALRQPAPGRRTIASPRPATACGSARTTWPSWTSWTGCRARREGMSLVVYLGQTLDNDAPSRRGIR